jgi:uncharacterized protein (DUF433 family)
MSEGIEIRRTPSLANDRPYLAEGFVVRVVDIVDRVRAGDSPMEVAKDFGVRYESVTLLMAVADELSADQEEQEQLADAKLEAGDLRVELELAEIDARRVREEIQRLRDALLLLAASGESSVLANEGDPYVDAQEECLSDLIDRGLLDTKRTGHETFTAFLTDAGRDFIRSALQDSRGAEQ